MSSKVLRVFKKINETFIKTNEIEKVENIF